MDLAARIADGPEQALEEALALSREEQAAVAFALAHRSVRLDSHTDHHVSWACREALSRLLRRTLPWTDDELAQLIDHMLTHQRGWLDHFVPLGPLVGTVERQAADHPPSRALTDATRNLAKRLGRDAYAEDAKLAARLRSAIGEGGHEPPARRDPWSSAAAGADPDAPRIATVAAAAAQSKPTRQFREQASALREELGAERLGAAVAAMIEAALAVQADEPVPPVTGDLLRGLAFLAAEADTDTAARAAGDLATKGLYVLSDQVRFLDIASNEPVPLVDVPRLAFTEAMRDVDLFVGVCSVGNDPTWRDQAAARDHLDYWSEFAFGELGARAEVRRDVLERLLPKLRLRDVATVEGRYLVVRGSRRTYKIHLGSANILMEPDDSYLCIVRDRTSGTRCGSHSKGTPPWP